MLCNLICMKKFIVNVSGRIWAHAAGYTTDCPGEEETQTQAGTEWVSLHDQHR